MTTKTKPSTETVLAQLEQEHAAMLDPLDIPGDWTPRERTAYEKRRRELRVWTRTLQSKTEEVAEETAKVAALVTWRDHLIEWRPLFCDELLALDPKSRDRAAGERLAGLRKSILNIDAGCAYWPNGAPGIGTALAERIVAAGYTAPPGRPGVAWFGCGPHEGGGRC